MRDALWHGQAEKAIEITRSLIALLHDASRGSELQPFFASCADTANGAAIRLLESVENNRQILINYNRAHHSGRRISTASAESVMNHVVNRRMSKRQQMRWSMAGAHYLLQTRVEWLDGRLAKHFRKRFPHFRSPELRSV